MEDLQIIVAGTTGSGKSTIALLIHKTLVEAGFKTVLTDDTDLSARQHGFQERCLKSLNEHDVLMRIDTKQLYRKISIIFPSEAVLQD